MAARVGQPTKQEHRLNRFHMQILAKSWMDHKTNQEVLELTRVPTMYSMLSQMRLCWLGRVSRMEDGRIQKDLMYGELATGTRCTGDLSYAAKMPISKTTDGDTSA